MNEYTAILYVDYGLKVNKSITQQQYKTNYFFSADDDVSAYDLAISRAKNLAKTLYANPDNKCTTVKLDKLYNGKPVSFKPLESIIQCSSDADGQCINGLDEKFKEVVFKPNINYTSK